MQQPSSHPEPAAKFSGKACLPCMRSKRRCDKGLPSCGRCLDKALRCQYSSVRPYTRWPKTVESLPRDDDAIQRRDVPARESASSSSSAFFPVTSAPDSSSNSNLPYNSTQLPPGDLLSSFSALAGADKDGGALQMGMDAAMEQRRGSMCSTTGLMTHEEMQLATQRHLSSLCPMSWPASQPSKLGPPLMLDSIPHGESQQQQQQQVTMAIPGSLALSDLDLQRSDGQLTRASHHKTVVKQTHRWLHDWLHTGHCDFIHRELYADRGFPPCMQDAFACLMGYSNKNEHNEQVVWQLIERHADELFAEDEALLSQVLDAGEAVLPDAREYKITEWLPKVQAAFICLYIRLFDGDVRQRSLAERHFPMLLRWLKQMAIEAELFYLRLTFAAGSPASNNNSPPSSSSRGGSASPGHIGARDWQQWVLAESTRRTWIVGIFVLSIFRTMKDRQTECFGKIPFTMRTGLWDATTAIEWAGILKRQDALFIEAETADLFYQVVSPSEVDSFGKAMIAMI